MQRLTTLLLLALLALLAQGCASTYRLVNAGPTPVVDGALQVQPLAPWNKLPRRSQDIEQEESWTRNGPGLDMVSFMAGVEDGEPIMKQRQKDERQVPVFRANMSPPELVAMIESYYRIRAGTSVFTTTAVQPATFLGQAALRMDYDYVAGDDVERRGRAIIAIVDERLYLMALDGTALHYFDESAPEFEAMVASATRSP